MVGAKITKVNDITAWASATIMASDSDAILVSFKIHDHLLVATPPIKENYCLDEGDLEEVRSRRRRP